MKSPKQKQNRVANKSRIAAKKARVIDLVIKKGKTIRETSKILKAEGFEIGASKSAVGMALKAIERDFSQIVPQERAKAYDRLQGFLDELETAKRDGKLDLRASISDSLQVFDRLSRLLGLDAPSKAIVATTHDLNPTVVEFLKASHGLSEGQLTSTFEYMNALPREAIVVDASYLPPAEEEQCT